MTVAIPAEKMQFCLPICIYYSLPFGMTGWNFNTRVGKHWVMSQHCRQLKELTVLRELGWAELSFNVQSINTVQFLIAAGTVFIERHVEWRLRLELSCIIALKHHTLTTCLMPGWTPRPRGHFETRIWDLGLHLEKIWPGPWSQRALALALASSCLGLDICHTVY